MNARSAPILLLFLLSGCSAAGLAAAASVSTLIYTITDNSLKVGQDIIAATAIACRALPTAQAAEQLEVATGQLSPKQTSVSWYAALCDHLLPSNPKLNVNSPVWVATGLTRITHGRD